ncbi:MAG TPA: hypothetical protein DCR71_03035 [Dehalococcoidia bacterium]|jgi:hypothetical protein|nr:hypothetical protein [Dehalococcoidia bacterium]
MLLSSVALMLVALCIFIVGEWRKMIHKKIRNFDVESTRLTCADFTRQLLEEKGLNYTVCHDIDARTGHCHYRKKEITLSYSPDSTKYLALYQAGHEVGHAFYGPGLLNKSILLSLFVILVSFALPLYAGWKDWSETTVLVALLPVYILIAAYCINSVLSEIKASLFSASKTKQTIGDISELKLFVIQDIVSDVLITIGLCVVWASAMWIFYRTAVYFL